eukprot:Colp12_sorted_trinity150504_noHs@28423
MSRYQPPPQHPIPPYQQVWNHGSHNYRQKSSPSPIQKHMEHEEDRRHIYPPLQPSSMPPHEQHAPPVMVFSHQHQPQQPPPPPPKPVDVKEDPEYQKKVSELKKEQKERREAAAEAKRLAADKQALESRIVELEEELKKKNAQIEKGLDDLRASQEQQRNLSELRKDEREERKALAIQTNGLAKKLHQAESTIEQLEKLTKTQEKEIQTLIAEVKESEARIEVLMHEKRTIQDEADRLQDSVKLSSRKVKKLTAENEHLKEVHEQTIRAECDDVVIRFQTMYDTAQETFRKSQAVLERRVFELEEEKINLNRTNQQLAQLLQASIKGQKSGKRGPMPNINVGTSKRMAGLVVPPRASPVPPSSTTLVINAETASVISQDTVSKQSLSEGDVSNILAGKLQQLLALLRPGGWEQTMSARALAGLDLSGVLQGQPLSSTDAAELPLDEEARKAFAKRKFSGEEGSSEQDRKLQGVAKRKKQKA